MYPRSPRGRILPKISTMPRQASEATSYLELHKLVIEKRRLQQELEAIEQRKQQIYVRLETLTAHIDHLKDAAEQLGQASDAALADVHSALPSRREPYTPSIASSASPQPGNPNQDSSPYDMVFLDY
ncbi:MAG: hypothetical protein ACTS2F_28175 [Thainema sp.]